MATIITVHGTNATGPEQGDQWWQVGSRFEQAIRARVAATSGELEFKPLIWDGRNSESSRFAAGSRLAGVIRWLEKRGEPYCAIGHSHGGSVMAHALVEATWSGGQLRHLRRWITVGTPFIETRRLLFLFSRLDVRGVAAYLIFAYLAVMWLAFVASSILLVSTSTLRNQAFDIAVILIGPLFLALVYRAIHRLQPEKLRHTQRAAGPSVACELGRTWLAFWHRGDEAIQGLKLLKDLPIKPFDRKFAAPVLAYASVLLLPLLMYALSRLEQYDQLADVFRVWFPRFAPAEQCSPEGWIPSDNRCADIFKQFARNNLAIIASPARLLRDVAALAGLATEGTRSFNVSMVAALLTGGVLLGFAGFWFISMAIHRTVLATAGVVSAVVSRLLNRFTRTQALRLGYGCDTIGERACGALERPPWLATPFPPLPEALETEITQASNDAAVASIASLRSALGVIAFSETDYTPTDLVTRSLSGRELVHTNYFYSDRLNKLVAYAISQEDGFQATPAFQSDPDYPLVARWYNDLLGRSTVSREFSAAGSRAVASS